MNDETDLSVRVPFLFDLRPSQG